MAETPRRRDPILGKKEQRVVGLFSAGRGEEGGKMGVRDEEEREEGRPGEGVSGVAGLEGGNEDGLEFESSVELRDSLRKWVYLVFGTSSILKVQFVCFFVVFFSHTHVHVGASNAIKVSLSQHSKFLSKRTRSHLSVSLCVRAASVCRASAFRSLPCSRSPTASGAPLPRAGADCDSVRRTSPGVPASGRTRKVCF